MKRGPIILSYVLTTYNKLPYLKEALVTLIAHKQSDEEIVITDGGSTDGSREYLAELFKKGKIDQFISEPDKGEAHGLNKGLLMARGDLIKFITDDDAYCYEEIQRCKIFMLEHPEIQVLQGNIAGTSIAGTSLGFYKIKLIHHYEESFKSWLKEKKPYSACGISLIIRGDSIPLFGLLSTQSVLPDMEYFYRISSTKNASIAFYTNPIAVHILNNQSNLKKIPHERMAAETTRTKFYYDIDLSKKDWFLFLSRRGLLFKIRSLSTVSLKMVKKIIKKLLFRNGAESKAIISDGPHELFVETFNKSALWLKNENSSKGEFIF